MLPRRLRSLIKVQIVYDRYRGGEVLLSPTYEYTDGEHKPGPAKRIAVGESLAECAATIWEFLFANLLEMQSEALNVALVVPSGDGDNWMQTLVYGLALAAASELNLPLATDVDTGQLELWDTLVA